MTINAKTLKDNPPEIGFLRGEVRKHIKQIQDAILEAKRGKLTYVNYNIEKNFAVTKMSNRDAQRFVYAALIDQLKMNDFKVRFVINKSVCYFNISWDTEVDKAEIMRQCELISGAVDKRY